MTTNEKWILTLILIVIIAALLYFNWDRIVSKITPEDHPDGEKCVTNDGKDGTYTSGICVADREIPESFQIRITTGGAKIYRLDTNGVFVLTNDPPIPAGTELAVISTDPRSYYETSRGWISGNEAVVILE